MPENDPAVCAATTDGKKAKSSFVESLFWRGLRQFEFAAEELEAFSFRLFMSSVSFSPFSLSPLFSTAHFPDTLATWEIGNATLYSLTNILA